MHAYDLARCHAAIEVVERRDKPVAEVPIAVQFPALRQLVDEVARCVVGARADQMKVHVDYREGVALVAFYRYAWVRAALAFVRGGGFPPPALHWIQGLRYGYSPEAIDRFVTALGALDEHPRRGLAAVPARRERLAPAERDALATAG